MPVISAVGRLRQEEWEFEPILDKGDTLSQKQTNQKQQTNRKGLEETQAAGAQVWGTLSQTNKQNK
jgi:hypothetical protein